jgi:hypothetical protein
MNAGLKNVASAILADVEPRLPARRKILGYFESVIKYGRLSHAGVFFGRQDAALYGRPGGPPLLVKT